jgi:ankyrin repeat protein
MWAAEQGHLEVVKALVQAGVDILLKNKVRDEENEFSMICVELGPDANIVGCEDSALACTRRRQN